MIIVEFILELLARIFVEIIFEIIILGTFRGIGKGIDFIKYDVFGLKRSYRTKSLKKTLERKFLYKKVELTENLNDALQKGQEGGILEIINNDKVFAEFYDSNDRQIEVNGELVFEVRVNQIRLKPRGKSKLKK